MKEIKFSYNWNNKLDCKAFTTIRLRQDEKYLIGQEYKIFLNIKKKELDCKGTAEIIAVKHFKLKDLNTFIAHLDTGYSKEECQKIILRMYPKVNFEVQELSLILIKYK